MSKFIETFIVSTSQVLGIQGRCTNMYLTLQAIFGNETNTTADIFNQKVSVGVQFRRIDHLQHPVGLTYTMASSQRMAVFTWTTINNIQCWERFASLLQQEPNRRPPTQTQQHCKTLPEAQRIALNQR